MEKLAGRFPTRVWPAYGSTITASNSFTPSPNAAVIWVASSGFTWRPSIPRVV